MGKVRVLIVEDSAVVRELLTHLIGSDPRLEVASAVTSAEEAIRVLPRVRPDIISMDIRLPGMNGLEATTQIMATRPTPIVVIAGSIHSGDLNIAMNALKAGALAVVEKPVGIAHEDYALQAAHICTQLYIMSEVRVIRQRASPAPSIARPSVSSAPPFDPAALAGRYRLVGVAASTGGPPALVRLLQDLGGEFPLPVALVQHISPSFHAGFVNWLDGMVPQKVTIARHGESALPGLVYVAPPDCHLELGREGFRLTDAPPIRLQRPSATRLFETMASCLGSKGIGVILTGMGDDGVDGLCSLRQAGGYTIAESADTAVVYGMPAAAVERGAVTASLDLTAIAPRLLALAARPGITP